MGRIKEEWDASVPVFQNKTRSLLGMNSDITTSPFVDGSGNVRNPYLDYQSMLSSNRISSKAKELIRSTFGLEDAKSTSTKYPTPNNPIVFKSNSTPTSSQYSAPNSPVVYKNASGNSTDAPEESAIESAVESVVDAPVESTVDAPVESVAEPIATEPAAAEPDKVNEKPSGDGGVAEAAKKYIGTPYVWGGESMAEGGMDCSGFVYNALNDAGIKVGRTTAQGYRSGGSSVSKSNLQPGDLVFYGSNGKATHVGVYIGDGKIVHSAGGSKNTKSNPGKGVSIATLNHRGDFLEARRYS